MKKKSRKIVLTVVIAAVLLAAGLFYLRSDGSGVNDRSVWVCTRGLQDIAEVSIYCREDDQAIAFRRTEDGSWQGTDGAVMKDEELAPYLTYLGYMKVHKKVSDTAEEKYDLAEPEYTVSVKYSDDDTYKYDLGSYAEGIGLYISPDGEGTYLLDQQRSEAVNDMVSSIYNVSLDVITFNEIRGIHLSVPGQEMITMNRSEAPRANSDFYWNIFKPYTWNADSEVISELADKIEKIGVLKRTNSSLTEKECGLDRPDEELMSIAMFDTYDNELTLYLGDRTDDGYTYCRTNFTDGIFMIDSEVEEFAQMTMDDLIDPTLYYYEVASVESCHVDIQGTECELTAEWETKDDGKRGQRFYKDGKAISGADYNKVADWFSQTKAEKITSPVDESGEIYGNILLTRLSAPTEVKITIREIPDNKDLLQVDLGGNAAAYIKRAEAEQFIELLKAV